MHQSLALYKKIDPICDKFLIFNLHKLLFVMSI